MSEPTAFADAYAAHARGVYAAALRVLGRPADAEEVAQEVFLRLWRDPTRFDPARGELGPYLRLMARSRALDLYRKDQADARARDGLELMESRRGDEREHDPSAAAELAEMRLAIGDALRRLPPEQREAVVLNHFLGVTAREIAQRSHVPFGTARSRIRIGLAKLRAECGVEPAPAAAGDS